jgi:hypothetical protein
MVQFSDTDTKLLLGLGVVALAAWYFTLQSAGSLGAGIGKAATRTGDRVADAAGTVYGDTKSVAKTGYKDVKSYYKGIGKGIGKIGSRFGF